MDNLGKGFMKVPDRTNFRPAPLYKRALAFILDLVVLNIIVIAPFSPMLMKFFEGKTLSMLETTMPDVVYTAIIVMSFMALLYFSLLQYYERQTIGMMIMKIQVTPEIGFWRSVIRNLFLLPIFPFSLLWLLEPLALLWRGKRLLETLTRTETVEKNG